MTGATLRSLTVAVAASALFGLTGCSGGSSPGRTSPTLPPIVLAPRVKQLLAQPVAKPRVCPRGHNGTTSGRPSPWVGAVDLSVFTKTTDSRSRVKAVGRFLHRQPRVMTVYFESRHEAYREFERLYTCSASVRASTIPASWRVVLRPGTTVAQRDGLVATVQRLPGVDVVACDPSDPCVDVVRSVDPSITSGS